MRRAAGPQGYRHATCAYCRHKGSSVHGLPAQKRRRLRPGSSPRSRLLGTHAAETDERLLAELRSLRQGFRKSQAYKNVRQLTSGQRIADTVAAVMGSWTFIICQSIILFVWIVLNVTAYVERWDPYPLILLNLALSFQAAYAAPFI